MKILVVFIIFASFSCFAQRAILIPQDNGVAFEHPSCRIEVAIDGIIKRSNNDKIESIVRKKGYRSLNIETSRHGRSSYVKSRKDDLVFEINSNSYAKLWNIGENRRKSSILLDEDYFKDGTDFESFLKILPNCISTGSGITDHDNFVASIRDYELMRCSQSFYDGYNNSNPHKSVHKVVKRALYSTTGKIGTLGAIAIIAPQSTIGVVALLTGVMGVNVVGTLFIEDKEALFDDGIVLIKSVLECERVKPFGRPCDNVPSLSKKGARRMNRYLQRMNFEDFSRKLSNYIVNERACSNPSKKLRNYKKLFREARRSF